MFLAKKFSVKSHQKLRDNSLSPTKGWGPFSRDVKSDYYHSFRDHSVCGRGLAGVEGLSSIDDGSTNNFVF
jgi:hypothetical protein